MTQTSSGWAIYERKRSRWRVDRRIVLLLAAFACMGAGVFAGADMAHWKRGRVFSVDDAVGMTDELPIEQRRKAIVAMQREGRRIIERLRVLRSDPDPVVVANAENALESIAASMR